MLVGGRRRVKARRTDSMCRARVLYWWVVTGGRDSEGEESLEKVIVTRFVAVGVLALGR